MHECRAVMARGTRVMLREPIRRAQKAFLTWNGGLTLGGAVVAYWADARSIGGVGAVGASGTFVAVSLAGSAVLRGYTPLAIVA